MTPVVVSADPVSSMVRPSTAWLAASSLSLLLCLVIAPPGHAQSGLLELSGDALDLGTAEVGAVAGPRSIELTNQLVSDVV